MPSVNFYRKKAEVKSGRSLIYLQFKYQGRKLVYSFGQSIDPDNWNSKKQRVKSNKTTTIDGDHSLNDLLDNLQDVCEKAYKDALSTGIPTPAQLKLVLDSFINQNKETVPERSLFHLIDRFIAGEIKNRGKDKAKATLNNYQAVKLHLQSFEKKHRYPITFESVNLDFFYKYTTFLSKEHDPKLSINTIAKDIRILKVFLAEGVDLELSTNYQFRHKKFSISSEDTDSVYLTDKEILGLYRHDFTHNKKLERVRDLFVFGCYIGMRFSDYSDLKANNIINIEGDRFIKAITKKTKEEVIIPCNPIVLELFEKYITNENKLPNAPSNQKFNDYIKVVCKEAKLKEKGRLSTAPDKELWECVSSHTARRSFATNLYLEGYPTLEIMKVTGHKTEKAFLKYIKITKLDTAKRLSAHFKKNWSEKLVRVAG